jgi:hypothetical protein
MNDTDLYELRKLVASHGATSVTLEPEIVLWLIDELGRATGLYRGLLNALENQIVENFAQTIDLADLRGETT